MRVYAEQPPAVAWVSNGVRALMRAVLLLGNEKRCDGRRAAGIPRKISFLGHSDALVLRVLFAGKVFPRRTAKRSTFSLSASGIPSRFFRLYASLFVLPFLVSCIRAEATHGDYSASNAGISAEHIGVNVNEIYKQNKEQLSSSIDALKRLQVKWVRFDFDWSQIQPDKNGSYNLSDYDAAVSALNAGGIKIVGIIDYTPRWANGDKPSKFYPPVSAHDYADFAGYLAQRYKNQVQAWEIWNEPNLGQFWAPSPSPRQYVALLKEAYEAIKKGSPQAIVLTGGLAQPDNSATSMRAADFLSNIYQEGAVGYFDAVGNHPYDSPRLPSVGHNWRQTYGPDALLRKIMSRYGDGQKKIWVTEIGAPTYGVSTWNNVASEYQQAEILKEAYKGASNEPLAGPVFWYNLNDFCPYEAGKDSECFYGLIRWDGSMKPAGEALKSLTSK